MISLNRQIALQAQNLSYTYPDRTSALQGVSFTVHSGACTAVLGPNGAGKSTLLLCLAGLLPLAEGKLVVCGQEVTVAKPAPLGRVGIVFADPDDQLFAATVAEDVAYGVRAMGMPTCEVEERVAKALEKMGITSLAQRPPHHLSMGQKRRAAIAGVLAMEPSIIILDEPTAFLDPAGVESLYSILAELHDMGITLVLATHDVDFAAQWANQVLILRAGSIYAQGERNLLSDAQLMQSAGLRIPLVSQVFAGLPPDPVPLSVAEGRQLLFRLFKG